MKKSLAGLKVLVTAGPTREYLDPVRFLSNPSTGKMGYALAAEAARRGAKVTLVLGPVGARHASPLRIIPVISAQDMYRVVMKHAPQSDIIIMTAAVSDYRPKKFFRKKIKKESVGARHASPLLALVRTPDILATLGKKKKSGQLLIGFAAETHHVVRHAQEKLRKKNLDLIIANRVGGKNTGLPESGFAGDKNQVWMISRDGTTVKSALLPKTTLACLIVKKISHLLSN